MASKSQAWAKQGWKNWLVQHSISPARFQQQAWKAFEDGQSGLISAPTGSGKTLAALGGPIMAALAEENHQGAALQGFQLLWITPLRALASDTRERLTEPIRALLPHWDIAVRTGEASARDKRLSETGGAQLLITTPESLAILLSHERSHTQFGQLRSVVVDEWHELMPSKRGVLLQLNLARLRALSPSLQAWGLSATIGNLDEALRVLVRGRPPQQTIVIQDQRLKPFQLHSILPPAHTRLPWAGHLGLSNLGEVAKLVSRTSTSIVFTNTRSQAELWFAALSAIWPEALDTLAIHHGSLDQDVRLAVEQGLRQGRLRCVVATSSLDLGVDFPAVDRVIQIGGARSVARTVQRAGRAKHRPGAAVAIDAVATQAMDLCEFAATRQLAQQRAYENREPLQLSFDVLSQHLMSQALAGGFDEPSLLAEVRSTHAFENLQAQQWEDVLAFLLHGSASLAAYPQYERLSRNAQGLYVPANTTVARRHRLGIGTIVNDSPIQVRFLQGGKLGMVEERFIARLEPGDTFNFAGRSLRLVRVENGTAWVRKSSETGSQTPAWSGSLLSMGARLGQTMQALLAQAGRTLEPKSEVNPNVLMPELQYLLGLLRLQKERSHIPSEQELLIEQVRRRTQKSSKNNRSTGSGAVFLYPFAGRVVHEGLALLIATRLAQLQANTFLWTCNEIGFMLLGQNTIDIRKLPWNEIFSHERLAQDLQAAVNFSELARKRFKEIAQIAGLVSSRAPGSRITNRQLQVSAGLLYDVLNKYDPDHILLRQARQEALNIELHMPTLHESLARMTEMKHVIVQPTKHTPFSFGLWAESFRDQVSNETWIERVQRLAIQNESAKLRKPRNTDSS